jgi:hypothetical protein
MTQVQSSVLNRENLGELEEAFFFPFLFLGGIVVRETRGGQGRPGQEMKISW